MNGVRSPPRDVPTIHVDDTVRYQSVIGVGGAMTDTSAWLLHDELPPPAQEKFISKYLAPALAAADLHPRIYAHDYKWLFWPRADALIANPAVARVIAGLAWHCYDGNPTVMTLIHTMAPRLDHIETECSSGSAPGPPAEMLIASFRNRASTALLWNLALDPRGGPVQPPNRGCPYCTGVVTVDERTHTVSYRSDYYELGQFSQFVQRGARRIRSNTFVSYNSPSHHHRGQLRQSRIDDVAFVNPDSQEVLLVHNNAEQAKRFAVQWRGRAFTYTLPRQATVTFLWR